MLRVANNLDALVKSPKSADLSLRAKRSNLITALVLRGLPRRFASEVVRELIEGYVRDRDISSYIDDLWERVGDKLAARRVKRQDIQRAIREVRARK